MKIRLVGLASGEPSPLDGQWLVEYDPRKPGQGPDGEPMRCHLVCTTDRDKARDFATFQDVVALYRQHTGTWRQDGEWDRPLTAYTIEVA